jgi:SRSO17 transposase
MEQMAEVVADSHYQRLHHMVSESAWDRHGVYVELVRDANAHFANRGPCALVIDESALAKKGDKSVGVARQWNGRLGKTDNCQVGVFGALTCGGVAALVDEQLYLPEQWTKDASRCEQAGIPEDAREFRTKGEIAFEMVMRARRAGLRFAYSVLDGGYGHLPWLLQQLEDEGEIFLAEVHSDQRIYLEDPAPSVPARRSRKGHAPSRLATDITPEAVSEWAARQPAARWRRLSMREGEKGEVIAEYLRTRVFVWDGKALRARHWHLLVRRELDGSELKFCLSNAKPEASLRHLATMQASRHYVERAFQDAKSNCGMAHYQVRGWRGWHHHMCLVLIALMFLAKERLANRDTAKLLSCRDVVEMLRHRLPWKINSEDDLVQSIVQRHERRDKAMKAAYQRQAIILNASG